MVRGDGPGHLVAHWSALHALFCGATAEAIGLYLRAARVHRTHGHHAAQLTCLFQLAMAQTYDGRRDDALKACARVVEMAGQHGERWNKASALWLSGLAHFHLGRLGSAVDAANGVLERILDTLGVHSRTQVVSWLHTHEAPRV